MSDELNTFGLKPLRFCKSFSFLNGWDVNVYLDQHEEDDEMLTMRIATRIDHPVAEFISISLSMPALLAERSFNEIDGEKALQSLLNTAGPMITEALSEDAG